MSTIKYRCTHCKEAVNPVLTAEHTDEAKFVYGAASPQNVAANPWMCPKCFGVGAAADFPRIPHRKWRQ